MLPSWRFLLDRGVNFRTKRLLLTAGAQEVLQLADVGLTGLAKDPEIFVTAIQRQLILITKDTDFIREVRYVLGHYGILYVQQSPSELQDTGAAIIGLAHRYPTLQNLRFILQIGGIPFQVP